MKDGAIGVGVCGIGGFAGTVAKYLLQHGPTAQPPLRLLAACDPNWSKLPEQVAKLREAEVEVYEDFDKLLARPDIKGVWLPLPINLHRPFTEKALAAGKFVMCEKPVAGCIDDADAMVAARDRAKLPVLIGYQDVYDPTTAQVKLMMLDGVIGKLKRTSLQACWPRGEWYFSRNAWAGRIRHSDAWVLDSPANNALSHYINITLLMMGSTLHQAAAPVSVEAELYRAAPIENYDTICARIHTDVDVPFMVLLTHACAEETGPLFRFYGEKGLIERDNQRYRIITDQGEQIIERDHANMPKYLVHAWARNLAGTAGPQDTVATLEIARQQTLAVCGFSEATPVHEVGEDQISVTPDRFETLTRAIPGIHEAFVQCEAEDIMLHETGRFSFTRPAGYFDLRGYHHFSGGRTPATFAAAGK